MFLLESNSNEGLKVIARNSANHILPYKGIFMTCQVSIKCVFRMKHDLQNLIGCNKESNLDDKASNYILCKSIGICAKSDIVVHVADYRSSCIKITSTMIHIATFLFEFGKLMQTFCILKKKKKKVNFFFMWQSCLSHRFFLKSNFFSVFQTMVVLEDCIFLLPMRFLLLFPCNNTC